MSKSILVMDMPENCCKCNLRYDNYGLCEVCILADEVIDYFYENNTKPDWCPLKEVPGKYVDLVPTRDLHSGEYEYGWNACIDEVLGGNYE